MQLSLDLDEFVVFDLETTGLSPWAGDEIIEIGAMKIFGSNIDEANVFQSLVNPNRPIPPDATRINGITNEMVKDAPVFDQVFPKFLEFIGNARLVAQNARFDMGFITKYLMQYKMKRTLDVYDTMSFSKRAYPEERRHNLNVISQRLGLVINKDQRHRSVEDVRLTALAFVALKDKLGERVPNPERYTV